MAYTFDTPRGGFVKCTYTCEEPTCGNTTTWYMFDGQQQPIMFPVVECLNHKHRFVDHAGRETPVNYPAFSAALAVLAVALSLWSLWRASHNSKA